MDFCIGFVVLCHRPDTLLLIVTPDTLLLIVRAFSFGIFPGLFCCDGKLFSVKECFYNVAYITQMSLAFLFGNQISGTVQQEIFTGANFHANPNVWQFKNFANTNFEFCLVNSNFDALPHSPRVPNSAKFQRVFDLEGRLFLLQNTDRGHRLNTFLQACLNFSEFRRSQVQNFVVLSFASSS